ncbi:MAG: WbqC family protein [Flavobacteriaceae bacterium]|nr:WbqC family protein [Flavobacteriaceae bacterium]
MNKSILPLTYFAPIDLIAQALKEANWTFEVNENYQKQSYRSRQYIYGANGKLLLNIPIKHKSAEVKKKQLMKEVKIENDFPWQDLHWKSLETAYRSSPYFEFYEDEMHPLYQKKFNYLIDFNWACWEILIEFMQLDVELNKTKEFHFNYSSPIQDLRNLASAKRKHQTEGLKYAQVFEEKLGFIPQLSILDLLFSQGPNTSVILEKLA